MTGFLLKPLLPWLLRQLLKLLVQAIGSDLRKRLPEVFAVIDGRIVPSIQQGVSAVYGLFFSAVQQVIHRDPTDMELRVLQLLFDPSVAASRLQPTTPDE
jgi:hypothetical protein